MKTLTTILLLLFVSTLCAQLSFYDQENIYTGTDGNFFTTKYALNYDYNGDGLDDILHFQLNELYVLIQGDGAFEQEELLYTHTANILSFSNSLDLNENGTKEFAISTSDGILVFSAGTTGLDLIGEISVGNPSRLELIDFNGDENVDIVYNTFEGVYLLESNGDGTYQNSESLTSEISEIGGAFSFAIQDIDNSGSLDLFVYDNNNGLLHVLSNDGSSLTLLQSLTQNSFSFNFGDFNLDGLIDVVIPDPNDNTVNIYLYLQESSSFQLASSFETPGTSTIITSDYNANGRTDLLINSNARLLLFESNGDGTFQDEVELIAQMPSFVDPFFSDFNADGNLDIVGFGQLSPNQIVLIPLFPQVGVDDQFTHISLRPHGVQYDGVAMSDLDLDNHEDLVLFSSNGAVYIFFGTEDGLESVYTKLNTSAFIIGGIVGDIDNDGLPDIIIKLESEDSGTTGSEVIVNQGNREFSEVTPFKQIPGAADIFINDYDKDGNPNLIVQTQNSGEINFLETTGDYDEIVGVDVTRISTVADFLSDTHLVDLNNDTWVDVIVGAFTSNDIEIYLNDQAGGFESPIILSLDVDEFPDAINAYDLDGDNIKELIVTTKKNSSEFKLKVFSRSAVSEDLALDQTYTSEFGGFNGFEQIHIDDFDNNGTQDVFVVSFDNLVSSFYLGNDQGLLELSDFSLSNFGQGLSVFNDFEKNELSDLVRINTGNGNIGIAKNNSVSEPNESTTQMDVEHTEEGSAKLLLSDPDYSGRLILMSEGSDIDATPQDGTFYTSNSEIGLGTEIEAGSFVVHTGSDSEINITNLTPKTKYFVRAYEYNSNEPDNSIIDYLSSAYASLEFDSKEAQTLSYPDIADHFVSEGSFEINITSSSNLSVDLAVVSGPIELQGNTATITGDGAVVISATQAGNTEYFSTVETFEFQIEKESQTLSYPDLTNHFVSEGSFEIVVTASSGLSVNLSVTSGPIELNGNVATITGDGDVVILAQQAGDNAFLAVEEIYEFAINKESQMLTFSNLADQNIDDVSLEVNITSSSELPVTVTLISGPVELDGTTVTFQDEGTVILSASQEGNEFFLPIEEEYEFEIFKVLGTLESQLDIQVHPNPTTSLITIKKDNSHRLNFELVDLNGKVLKKGEITNRESHISLKKLEPGAYLLRVEDGEHHQSITVIKE